jgi:hypothetical protein
LVLTWGGERCEVLFFEGTDFEMCFPLGRLGSAIIAVMQSTEAWPGHHLTPSHLAHPAAWSCFAQPKMSPVLMIVVDVSGQQSSQVALVESDHVVQQIASAALHPTFGEAVLPRTLKRGSDGVDLHGSNSSHYLEPILCIPVEDQESGCRLVGKRLPQLLDDPSAIGMPSDVEVQDAPAVMADDEECVENAEGGWRP